MAKPYVIGVDMGGTNTCFGIVDARGTVIASSSIKTRKHADINDYIEELYQEISKMIKENDAEGKIQGIGIGAPNGNYFTGKIEDAPNLPWPSPIPLAQLVSDKFGIQCIITNDANAAALGEMTYGVARGLKDFIMITLGTGVGSGIVVNGQMVYGHNGFAGELGHVVVKPSNGRQCGCGRKGCLETYTSATGIRRTAIELMEQRPMYNGVLKDIPVDKLTSKMVGDAANAGDPIGIQTFENVGYLLGVAMANAVTFSAPQAIFLMGGPVHAGEVLMKPLRKSFEENLLFIYKGTVDIRVSELSDNEVAILGAAALCQL